ncbi:MAG: ABC transporter permease [Dorea sp.]|nr:ABC transporter permease [Dorea sp.]
MASSIYKRLAVTNLKNNYKTYVPYILTAVLTVMMYYIMDALSYNKSIGEGQVQAVMQTAVPIIAIFAVIFLFYTNSFLIKRRKKEIGVYNILGMGKRHIARMLMTETVITAGTGILGGLAGGLVFSRLMYLVLLKILRYDVRMEFEVSWISVTKTIILFGAIFLLTLTYNLLQVRLSNPIELLHGTNAGEKEPKTKWILTVFGIVAIGIGYGIALRTESPLSALTAFFLAVACVILGTYALFVAGSVAVLKLLKKNKKFYYKTSHFTAVSGMIYRMKQNAVGLANICILSTMVLVMISTTICMYAGMEDIMNTRFPMEFEVTNYATVPEEETIIEQIVEEECRKYGVTIESGLRFHEGDITAKRDRENFDFLTSSFSYNEEGLCELHLIPVSDYNEMENRDTVLNKDEILIYTPQGAYGKDHMKFAGKSWKIKEELEECKIEPMNQSGLMDKYYIILPDMDTIKEIMRQAEDKSGFEEEIKGDVFHISYVTRMDFEGGEQEKLEVQRAIGERLKDAVSGGHCTPESRELHRESFYMLYGGLLFIGIYLGILFLMATVLIIYYKQISEGYDDKERYQIMQKVGMSKQEVRRSIRSQVLLVFFLPLLTAIIHILVAFKVITKLLVVLNMVNVPLFAVCTAVTVAVFAVFYGIVYGVTAKEYYKIVN